MADTSISANIFSQCTPAAGVDASRVDGMTLVNVKPDAATTAAMDTIYRDKDNAMWRLVGDLLEADFRGKACQAKVNGFAEWLKGSARVMDAKRMTISDLKTGLRDVRPFIQMEVKNPINNYYWNFKSGTAAGADEKTPNFNSSFDWKGIVSSSKGIPADIRWFGQRSVVTISGKGSSNTRATTSYRVVDAAIVGADLVIYLVRIGFSAADPIYALEDNHYKRGHVEAGVLTRGLPNVTTGEAFCDNIPGLNTKQLKSFWIQQTRRTIKEDSEYEKYVKLIMENNPYFRQFSDVDSVEYNRQVQEDYDNRLVETFFHNPALDNQTPALYADLEKVAFYVGNTNSPSYAWEGRYQCRRANALGYFEQMAACDNELGTPRLIDMLGAKLSLGTLHKEFYQILRHRKSNGLDGKVLELWMTSDFREKMVAAYVAYFKAKSVDTLRINMDAGSNALGFDWYDIKLDWPGVTLRLVTHLAIDDYVAAHKDAFLNAGENDATAEVSKKVGNLMFAPDWSVTYRALLDGGTVVRETDLEAASKVDASLLCGPLVAPKQRVKHYWETFTQVVECGNTQAVWENFDNTGVDQ